ncbi:MAG TPA: hypothetical protein VFN22_13025 [Gemmatimonadales bacterium]|nr:hypothetical protein [Gemmatimonadales bacterium]
MRRLTAGEVHAQKIRELGLDSEALDLATPEGLAGALRRAAAFLCPCATATLVRAVVRPLRGLVPDMEKAKELVEETLEAMISHGDVLEQREMQDGPLTARLLLYTAPASFVVRQSGLVILLGVTADHLSPLPSDLEGRIQHFGHVRRLNPSSATEDLRTELRQLGLLELASDVWLKGPKASTPTHAIAAIDRALDVVPPSRDIPGLLLLDPMKPVRYYRGRWTEPKTQTGRFVARRQQAYGADLWCYVHLVNGQPERMMDLPKHGSRWRGCDEAWHLQMAIDAERGTPQCFRVSPSGDAVILEFFSPAPAWARRRWDAIGEPILSAGSLFAYRIAKAEIDEELSFLQETLWLDQTTTGSR